MIDVSPRLAIETSLASFRILRAQLAQITHTLGELERGLQQGIENTSNAPPKLYSAYGYVLLGQEFAARDPDDILISVLRHFSDFDPGFPERYSRAARRLSRKRLYVAQSRYAFYPRARHLATVAKEFAPGWYVNTYEGNEKKLDLLRCACKVLDLRLGLGPRDSYAIVAKVPGVDA